MTSFLENLALRHWLVVLNDDAPQPLPMGPGRLFWFTYGVSGRWFLSSLTRSLVGIAPDSDFAGSGSRERVSNAAGSRSGLRSVSFASCEGRDVRAEQTYRPAKCGDAYLLFR